MLHRYEFPSPLELETALGQLAWTEPRFELGTRLPVTLINDYYIIPEPPW